MKLGAHGYVILILNIKKLDSRDTYVGGGKREGGKAIADENGNFTYKTEKGQ